MRIPIDYDNTSTHALLDDLTRVIKFARIRGDVHGYEVWATSPGNLRAVIIADVELDDALDIIDVAECDRYYKEWARRNRSLTERVTSKNQSGIVPRRLLTINF